MIKDYFLLWNQYFNSTNYESRVQILGKILELGKKIKFEKCGFLEYDI